MRQLIRLTESDLKGIVNKSVERALNETIDRKRDIQLAQKELFSMGKNLSSIGLRLQGTPYEPLYERMKDAMVRLNDTLIRDIRGNQ
jgi:hypothetical protein